MLNRDQARELITDEENYTDEEIDAMLFELYKVAEVCYEHHTMPRRKNYSEKDGQ